MRDLGTDLGVCTTMDALLAAAGRVAGLQIVDIGSGEGAFARQLAERGAIVTGVDPLGPAMPWTEAGGGRYRLLRQGAEALPFPDGSVDVVTFIFSLHHVPGPVLPGVLREAARVLKPGGLLHVAEPLAAGPGHEVTSLFHDETAVRAEAAAILATQAPLFRTGKRLGYSTRRQHTGFEDYATRMVANMRFNGFTEDQIRAPAVQARFAEVFARTGGVFDQPVQVDLFTR